MKKILLLLGLLLITSLIFAKEVKIKIIDKDLDLVLDGAKIIVSKPAKTYVTDKNGYATIEVEDNITAINVMTTYPGYQSKKMTITDFSKETVVKMVIEGILEGKELVVEEKAIGKTDDKVGVSNVVTKQEIKTNTIGVVEDVMSSIKMLPGVGFTNAFDAAPSIRGGSPDELTAVYDGLLIRNPFHWGGAFSIFNPNIVESAKLSHGIYSVKNGMSISGLLEVNSKKPDDNRFSASGGVSTSSGEAFLQIPMTAKSGLLIGARVTYYDLAVLLFNDYMKKQFGLEMNVPGYIRDGYLKWFWKPNDRIEWYINGMFWSDGIGVKLTDDSDGVNSTRNFSWYNYNALGSTGLKLYPNDKILINILAGYTFNDSEAKWDGQSTGYRNYSDDFIDLYSSVLGGKTGYNVPGFKSDGISTNIQHDVQGRIDVDVNLHEKIKMEFGGGVVWDYYIYKQKGNSESLVFNTYYLRRELRQLNFDVSSDGKQILNSNLYLNFTFDILPKKLSIEFGTRVDHCFLFWNGKENNETVTNSLNTYPVPNPRFNISYTPVTNLIWLDKLTLSYGSGLFSRAPDISFLVDKSFGIKDFEVWPTWALSNVLGLEMDFPLDFKLKIEGYYKYYFKRTYVNSKLVSNGTGSYDTKYFAHSDGTAHVSGFDIMLQRKVSKYLDGMFTYSFVYARYNNPQTDGGTSTFDGSPTGIWYYPSFHRFHNLNLLLNIKPLPWLAIIPKVSFATGTPQSKLVGISSTPVYSIDPNTNTVTGIMQYYTGKYEYDDELRNGFSIPFDLKIAFNFYFPKTKLQFEAYAACENIFALVYQPSGAKEVNAYSGKEEDSASSTVNFPIPSIGIKLNF